MIGRNWLAAIGLSAGLAGAAWSIPSLDSSYVDSAPGNDWPGTSRTYGEQHYSPLAQIDASTVSRLGLAWSYDLPPGNPMSMPVEAKGVLFTATGYSVVRAFDVETGRLLWETDTHAAERAGPRMTNGWGIRGLAWWNDKIYVGTQDGRLIALDAKNGHEVWSQQTLEKTMALANITGAPRILDGKVIIGFGGSDFEAIRGYVTAYDAESGRKLWRFYMVPGNPAVDHDETTRMAAKTWTGEWWKLGGGGTAWNAMTYDPETDTVFIGTGNGSPWNHRVRSPGGGDNLFLCSILALDARTGKYKWHYQINPGESWDYNAAMSMPLATLMIDGKPRKVIMQAPKNGFFYVIDRITGKLISAEPFAYATWASKIDAATGRPVENPDARYPDGKRFELWPNQAGAHNWLPLSFSPKTGLVYIPTTEMGVEINDRGVDRAAWKPRPADGLDASTTSELLGTAGHPSSTFLQAWDPVSQKRVWKIPTDIVSSGVLATGGHLVFEGRMDGALRAIDDRTGRVLWSFATQGPIVAPPISYSWKGRQYISVLSGVGGSFAMMSAMRGKTQDYRQQARRVLTFMLDGKASEQIKAPPAPIVAAPDPGFRPGTADLSAGMPLFHANCAICHGGAAIGVGLAPDLRGSSVPPSADAFRAVVHDGVLKANGMPQFDRLPEADREAIRAYLRSRAHDLAAGK